MGDVAVTFQIMPEGKEVDLKEMRNKVEELIEPNSIEEEPVAFGLNSLKVLKVIPDGAGGTDDLEEKLSGIAGVQGVRVIDQRRLL